MLRAARSAAVAAGLALGVMAPGAAAATGTVTDPAGDVACPAGFTVDCGSDLRGTTWTTHPDGSVTISVSRVETSCGVLGGTVGPTIFLTAPDGRPVGGVGFQIGDQWLVFTATAFFAPLRSTDTVVGGVTTSTLVVPERYRNGFRDFDYFITNSCGANAATVHALDGSGVPSDSLPNGGRFGPGPVAVKVQFPPSPVPSPGPTVATGTVRDPAGDVQCQPGMTVNCGSDLRSTTWTAHRDGSVMISVSRVTAPCDFVVGRVVRGLLADAAIIFGGGGFISHWGGDIGGELWLDSDGSFLRATDTIVGGVDTSTLVLPASRAGGGFDYSITNQCDPTGRLNGSFPSDLLPNAQVTIHVRIPTQALVTRAVAKALATAKPTSAATLIKKGFPVTITAPAAGTLTVSLARTKLIRVHGVARAQTRVLAKLTAKVTAAGVVKRTVKLTRAGKALLREARKTTTLKLTVSFTTGALSATKSKTVRIKPVRN
jgi:hypothetical protein